VDAASGGRRDGRGEKRRQSSISLVKRLLALLLGGLGIRALLRRRGHAVPGEPSPAEELRAKLADTKDEPVVEAPPEDVDARRADVHERARRAIDELGES
jgi:hypothetical protein